MTTNDNLTLWRYCLWLYSQPGVEASCLLLQDQFGLKINLILLSLYAQQQTIELSSTQLLQLHRQQEFYHQQYLWPLRNLRRSLAGQAPVAALLSIELQLEQHEIGNLQQWLSQWRSGSAVADCAHNLDRYWRLFHNTLALPGKSVFQRYAVAYGLIPEG